MTFIDFNAALQKFDSNQPRAPKGQSGGGRFVSSRGTVLHQPTDEVAALVRDHLDGTKAGMKRLHQDVVDGIGRAVVVDGKPVAYGLIKRSLAGDDIYEMGHVVTHPDHQAKGYSGALMADLEQSAKKAGAKVMLLCASDDKVIGLYEKRGYKMIDEDSGLFAKSLKG